MLAWHDLAAYPFLLFVPAVLISALLLDYGSVIVHVFTPPERDFYQLERHWSEAKTVLRVQ